MLTALLFTLFAHADTPTELPQPDTRRAVSMKTLAAIRDGETEAPEVLVPWNYASKGKLTRGRYYDEQGRVFNRAQVGLLLLDAVKDGCTPCEEPFRKQRRQSATVMVSGGLMALLPVTIPVALPLAIGNIGPANRNFGRTIAAYNDWGNDALSNHP